MERVKITPSQFWVKDASGVKAFDSSYKYLKTSPTGSLKVGGIPKTTMVAMVDGNAIASLAGFPASISISGDSYTITLPPCDSLFSSNSLDAYYSVSDQNPDAILPVSDAHTIDEMQDIVLNTPFEVEVNGVYAGDLKIEYIQARLTDGFDQYGERGHRYTLPSMTLSTTSANIITFDLPHVGTSYSYTWTRTYSINLYGYGYTPPVGETGTNTGPVWYSQDELLSPHWACSSSPVTLTLEVV